MSGRSQSRAALRRVMSWGLKQAEPCSSRAWTPPTPRRSTRSHSTCRRGRSVRMVMVTVTGPPTGPQPSGKGKGRDQVLGHAGLSSQVRSTRGWGWVLTCLQCGSDLGWVPEAEVQECSWAMGRGPKWGWAGSSAFVGALRALTPSTHNWHEAHSWQICDLVVRYMANHTPVPLSLCHPSHWRHMYLLE